MAGNAGCTERTAVEPHASLRILDWADAAEDVLQSRTRSRVRQTRLFGVPAPEPDEDRPLEAGCMAGDYRVERHLADGGMASVYAAIHPLIGKRAAVKVLNSALSRDEHQIERFLQEARAVNTIRHPNIVDIFAFGRLPDRRHFLVMELLEGDTLFQRIWEGPLPLDLVLNVLLQTCDALEAAHLRRIAHLDLKPENVFLVPLPDGRTLVKLLDFGIARLLGVEPREEGEFSGTPDYASPEQAAARPDIDHRSDIYSLGVVAYELLTGGTLPFSGTDPLTTLERHEREQPLPPSAHGPVMPALDDLVVQMMAKRADDRPSLMDIRQTLRAALAQVTAPPVVVAATVPRRPTAWVAGVAALALAVVGAIGVSTARERTSSLPRPMVEVLRSPPPIPPVVGAEPPARVEPPRVGRGGNVRKHRALLASAGADYVLDFDGHPR
jgi:serine/threonine protein kinase